MPPVAIAAPAIGLSLASTAFGALGAANSGAQQAAMANYQAGIAQQNSQIAQQNARQAIAAGGIQASNAGLAGAQQLGKIRTAEGASNLDVNSGSNVNVQKSQAEITKLNQLTIQNNAARAAYGYQVQATGDQAQAGLFGAQASAAQQAGKIGVFSSLLGGASSLTGNLMGMQQKGIFGGSGGGNTLGPLGSSPYDQTLGFG